MLASSGAALTAVGRRRRRRSQLSVPSGADCLRDGPAGRGRVSSRGHFIVGRYRPVKRDVLPKRLGAVSSPTQAGRGGAARSHWRPRVASVPEAALEAAASGLATNTPDLRPFAPCIRGHRYQQRTQENVPSVSCGEQDISGVGPATYSRTLHQKNRFSKIFSGVHN